MKLVPTFIGDREENKPFELFCDMIGEHFDPIWTHIKEITQTTDNSHKLGISKNLVYYMLQNLGIEAYDQFDQLYDFNIPGIGGLSDEGIDQFTSIMEFVDLDSPVTLQSIRDIATGAARGTPYMFPQLAETIENLRIARSKAAEAYDNIFRLEQTGGTDAQIQAATRAANRFMNEADDLQLMLNNMIKGTIE